jgi:hypothetical protein
VDSGSTTRGSSVRSGRSTSSRKTPTCSEPVALTLFSGTSMRSGMMRSGTVFPLPPLVRLTKETERGLWPTPTATLGKDGPNRVLYSKDGGPPRPNSRMYDEKGNHVPITLDRAVRWWVTPTARDWKDTPGMVAMRNGRPRLDQLPRQVYYVEGTPPNGGHLNPTWEEWLMGFPLEWTVLSASEMPSSHTSRSASSKQSANAKKVSD